MAFETSFWLDDRTIRQVCVIAYQHIFVLTSIKVRKLNWIGKTIIKGSEAIVVYLMIVMILLALIANTLDINWAPSSEFVSSSIPSWQTSTAHAQPFRGARDLACCLKDPLDSLLVWASSEGSGETARMRRLAWTFAARIGDKYQIRLSRSNC